MRRISFILQKEFIQIFRTPTMVLIIFVMPVIQLLLLSNAATFEMKNIRLQVVDMDQSQTSHRLIQQFTASGYFLLTGTSFDLPSSEKQLDKGSADIVMRIPSHFERDLRVEGEDRIQFIVNAVDGSAGTLAYAYASQILTAFNVQVRAQWLALDVNGLRSPVTITFTNRFNKELNYTTFMVPGLLVMLVTLVGMFLAAMNIVREKEIGTIEQLNVTPIRKAEFIIGKLLPFWILAILELTLGLIVGKLAFHIPIVGSIALIYLFAGVYLLTVLGIGLLVSTVTETQQQAMFLSWFFMVLFVLMSGLFTPIESMPDWAQKVTLFNPIAYFIRVMRMVMLKGSGLADVQHDLLVMLLFAVFINGMAVLNYRKTSR